MRSRFTGPRAWLVQRVSAVYMLFFFVFLLGYFSLYPLHTYAEWRSWLTNSGITLAIVAFFAALLSHMWVGLRDVLLDYARPAVLRRLLLGTLGVGLLGTAAWVIRILLRLHT